MRGGHAEQLSTLGGLARQPLRRASHLKLPKCASVKVVPCDQSALRAATKPSSPATWTDTEHDFQCTSSFDWLELPSGRARFSGGIRGFDELGHETFAVEVDGREYFGEIGNIFLPNGNDYNMEVISFGYGRIGSVGMPMLGTCQIFTSAEIATIQRLIVQLIAAGMRFEDRPTLLTEYPNAHFMGQVIFRDGWVLAKDEASS